MSGRGAGICGVWPASRSLIAVVLRPGGRAEGPLRFAGTAEACEGFLAYLQALGVTELVLPEALARDGPLAAAVARDGCLVWIAPRALIESLRAAAGLTPTQAKASAAMLARLPGIAALRAGLRRCKPVDRRQLRLL